MIVNIDEKVIKQWEKEAKEYGYKKQYGKLTSKSLKSLLEDLLEVYFDEGRLLSYRPRR